MRRLPRTNSSLDNWRKYADVLKLQEIMTCAKLYPNNEANNVVYLVINGPFRGSSSGTGRATRRWLQP